MLSGFKQFILRGNVIDLAIGVVIGAAFNSVVNSLVKDVLTPFIGFFLKTPGLENWTVHVHGTVFPFGDFLNSILTFLIEAAAIYFFVVLPVNAFLAKTKKPAEPNTKQCPFCKSDIPKDATKCAHCTSSLQ